MSTEPAHPLLIRANDARAEVTADPAAGRRTAEDVAAVARAAGEFEALVIALCAAGWAAREVYDHAAALRNLDEAVRVARHAKLDHRLAEALVTRAGVHMEYGRTASARRDIAEARSASTEQTRAEVEFAEALLHGVDGNQEEAAAAYRRALRHARPDQVRVRLRALHNLGLVEVRRGRHDAAARCLDLAADLAVAMEAPALAAVVATSQAFAASERGDPLTALRRFDEAGALMTEAGVPRGEMLADQASALLNLRLLDEAEASITRAVEEFSADDGRALMLAEALVLQARIEVVRERHEAVAVAAARAEALLRRQRRPGWRAQATLLRLTAASELDGGLDPTLEAQLDRVERTMLATGHLPGVVTCGLLAGRLALEQGRTQRARRKLTLVVRKAGRGPTLVRLQGRTAAALLAEADGDRRRLAQECRIGLEELGRYRATFASAELRARAWAHGVTLAEIGLRSALRSGRAESVWCWLERGRSVVFVRTEADADPTRQTQLAQLRQLERELTAVAGDPASTALVLRRIRRAERDIRHQAWRSRRADDRWTLPTVRGLRRLRASLDDRILLQYGVLDGRVVGVAVSRRRIRVADVAAADAVAWAGRQLAFALRRLSAPRSSASVGAARQAADHELDQLGRTLVAPFAEDVESATEAVVAPPAELIGVPWGSLPVLDALPVRVVPSATAWLATRERRPTSERVVAVAGPGVDGAAAEVEAVAATHDAVSQLVGSDAGCARVRDEVAGARLVHLACHGHLRPDSPAFSSLALADGPLTVHDLERLEQPAHHWVLATCELGGSGRLAGPELEGVLAALLFGGAAGIVASGVSIPDVATVAFMVDLHAALAGGASLAEAVLHARWNRDVDQPAEYVTSVAFSCFGGG